MPEARDVTFTSNGRHSSSISRLLPTALPGPPAPASGVQRRCFALHSETLPRRRPGHPSTPHLMLFCAECRPTRIRTSQVSHSSPSATPLPRLPHLRGVPVWGLAIVHRLGALCMVWSTWSTNESHRKMTVRERLTVGTHHGHGRMHATASFLP